MNQLKRKEVDWPSRAKVPTSCYSVPVEVTAKTTITDVLGKQRCGPFFPQIQAKINFTITEIFTPTFIYFWLPYIMSLYNGDVT